MEIKIFEILESRNLSVYWLARHTGISEQLLGKYKNKKIENITLINSYKIAKVLRVKIDDLIIEEHPKHTNVLGEKKRMQRMADGIILACSGFINEVAVSEQQVITVLSSAGITVDEWNSCEDVISKERIVKFLHGNLDWLRKRF